MIIALVVIAVLIAVGAFFFTFEEFDEEEGYNPTAQVQEDPYALAKAKQVPAITTPAAKRLHNHLLYNRLQCKQTPQQVSQHRVGCGMLKPINGFLIQITSTTSDTWVI